ncbi:MAG: HAMP domain-containing histidine kinase [Cytophagaceae bacterium]|nr:MAG: HAMP domain-containing histidine kinase [Cytophagaceae bacterium]
MVFIERHIFLLLAIVACFASALCYTFLERNAPGATDEQYVTSIQERIKTETKQCSDELDNLAANLKVTPNYTFNALSEHTQYPYYVYKNKRLLYWSDNRFIPDFDRVAAIRYPKLVDFDQGRFIVSHKQTYRKGDTLDVFSLIMVYRRYTTTNPILQSGYNPALFSLDPLALTTKKGAAYQNIYDSTPVFLFSVVPPRVDPYRNRTTPVNTVILATLAVLFFGLYVIRRLRWASQVRQYELGFLWLTGYLLLLRGVMLYLSVPYLFIENDLFNEKYYPSSESAPSLGDLILNSVALLIVAFYIVNNFYRSRTYNRLIHLPAWAWAVSSVVLILLSSCVYLVCFSQLNALYEKSQYTLDLALSIEFPPLKVASLLFFITLSIIYFLAQHILVSLFIRFNPRLLLGLGLFLLGNLLSFGLYYLFSGDQLEPLYLLNSGYFLALYISRFPRFLYTFQYKTSLYFFLGSFVCASTAASVVYRQQILEDLRTKKDLGDTLLAQNDEYGELLLSKAQTKINNDPEIRRVFLNDTLLMRRERIQERIKGLHLNKYFDKYDTEVSSFDVGGTPLDASENPASLSGYVQQFQQKKYKTKFSDLYFVNEVGNQFIKQYVDFVDIYDADSAVVGYVVLDLKIRKKGPGSDYFQFLTNDKLVQSPKIQQYSHAVYERIPGSKAFQRPHITGTYNYERRMPASILNNPVLYDKGITHEGFVHLGIRGDNGRTLVISSPKHPYSNVFANFSFLFLILVLTVIVVIVLYSVQYGFSRFSINYSTRIQILLNLAFFLPLLLVVVIIFGVISSNYISNQEANYISNTKNIAANFQAYLDEHVKNVRSKEAMEQELEIIARDANIDINLFDTTGHLYSTTRKLMYESGHLSPYINPLAFMHIAEDKENQVLLNESLGTKQFSTAYAGVKSFDGKFYGRLMGILSIPYFEARPELDRQLLEVISSALSVFTSLFLFFLILSYFASSSITKPLRIMTQKIRRTSLDRLNQTIEWQSDDEIGSLVKEYNRMLTKLEESKFSLAQSEKQSAWREMAKQVAHEIKNPLTPMKLTLQQLQRTLPGTNPVTDRAVSRTLDSLLDQIDNISDIATSFSDFANMPMPQNELVELTSVVHKAVDLYADDKRVSIRRQIEAGPVWIMGDRQLLMRIMTNLIINGIQSVPPDQRPIIDIRLFTTDDNANIEIHDNGLGIPESIRSKVFLPNFSTKEGGTGIGLAISKRGIEHAGGSIWFETDVNVGTSFFIAMPLAGPARSGSN